jgi:hypothetical protein
METPIGELPRLTPERKAIAKGWGLSEEDERRLVLRLDLAEKRMEAEGAKLGDAAVAILRSLGDDYRLRAVIRDGREDGDILRIESPGGVLELKLVRSLRERILHNAGITAQEDLKREILTSLGRSDLLVAR